MGLPMSAELIIDGIKINKASRCYVIAEVGHNHQGSLEKCKEIFKAAKECGAHAVKLQKRDNRALFTEAMYNQAYNSENAYGPTYGTHREALEFGKDEYVELKKFCKELGITFFSTAFDFNSADFLHALDMPAYKMASGDLKSIPLLKHVAKLGKPMVISTGGGTWEDIQRAYDAIIPINSQLSILQCTAAYPADFSHLDLRVIERMQERFPKAVVGWSSHDSGIAMALGAYMLGARVIEKHFTLNRTWKGTDHAFSLEPVGMKKMVRDLNRLYDALGDGEKKVYEEEKAPLVKMGKKLVITQNLPEGHTLSEKDITLKSPGDGVPPYELEKFLGKKLSKNVSKDQALTFNDIFG